MPDPVENAPVAETPELPELSSVPTGGELPETDPDASNALDDLLKQTQADETPEPEQTESPEKSPEPAAESTSEPQTKSAPVETKPASAEPVAQTDEFDKVQLPPYTKPKSAEAFAEVKSMARRRIAEMEKETTELREKLKATEELAKNGLTAEQKAEFEELRKFRSQMEVEADPTWKEYDGKVKQNDELIYKKLRDSGASEEQIERIQSLGGPSEVDWDAISDKLPSTVKRFIDAKLVENEDLEAKKSLAKEQAKKNAEDFFKTKESSFRTSVQSEVESLLPTFPWMKEKPVTGTDAEKALASAHNKMLQDIQANVQEAINDDSPKMKALLVAGFAQFLKTRTEALALKAELTQLSENSKKEIDTLRSSLKEKEEFIAKMKKASTSRLGGSAPTPESKSSKVDYSVSPSEHLDRLLAEAQSNQ